jgi:3-hydroxy-3-methylglutaryl CoA synthase
MSTIGITGYGAYIPRLRMQRASIVEANAWANAALKAHAKGERAICNWDEDSVTMAVEAARDCLGAADRSDIAAVHLASTTLPFADRQNAGIVAEALNLGEDIGTLDVTSSQRAGTTGLINALRAAADGRPLVFIAAEHRRSQNGSPQELLAGDGAAALTLGGDGVVARCVASHSVSVDFVDHYRGQHHEFDYEWEERWIRDEGYMKIVPQAVSALLEKAGVEAEAIDRFILPASLRGVPAGVAKRLGIRDEAVADVLQGRCGDTGAAHAVLLLVKALEEAGPGERILVIGFGQGCDAILLETTDAIAGARPGRGVNGCLDAGAAEDNYNRFLSFNNIVEKDFGKRAEVDRQTALTALYRNRKMLTGFIGGKCERCGTVQFPKERYCVNPNCGALDSQADHPMADTPGKVNTYTADSLTFSPDPPTYFGMVQFDGGGRLMVDFTDVDRDSFDIGAPVRMQFRIREFDEERGFRKYFWKAVQTGETAARE